MRYPAIRMSLPVPAGGEDTQDGDGLGADHESDGQAPLEADDAQVRPDVRAQMPTLGADAEAAAEGFHPVDIADGDRRRGGLGDPVVKADEILRGLGREGDAAFLHERPESVLACRSRMAPNTSSAERARSGLASIAS